MFKILFPLLQGDSGGNGGNGENYQDGSGGIHKDMKIDPIDIARQSSKKLMVTSNKKSRQSIRLGG